MIKRRVLIAEDESAVARYLSKILVSEGFSVVAVANGKLALQEFQEEPFPVLITDLNMPEIDGLNLIKALHSNQFFPTVIVYTSESEVNRVIEVMKENVWHYIVKPGKENEIKLKVKNAFEFYKLNQMQRSLEKEKEIRLQEQLSWLQWQQSKDKNEIERFNINLIQNLKHSFHQAGGIGALLSILQFVSQSLEEENGRYVLDKDVVNLIMENAKIAEDSVKVLDEILSVSQSEMNFEDWSIEDLHDSLSNLLREIEPIGNIESQSFLLSALPQSFKNKTLKVNVSFFLKAIREIFVNACKFSKPNSEIFIIFSCENNFYEISILNEPKISPDGVIGIPQEFERIIFEPFYRIFKTVDERYNTLDMGLGLSLVEKIISKQNGKIEIYNIKDHTSNVPKIKVNTKIYLPVL
jgi:YesN/AraC family two-component response regulator